ncbi:hypothetical protein J5X98_23850 [Leptothermofonsia sichuanensis E412]|uniref:nucleotide exchange factor GrpE n=1 Tax=Leptothermofonsia sichuanensis TaxID=2917832 RepID=UPI001CA6970B|nr:hypothetical protein [Leptothermofonsia sichuanensis]QZZ20261.1 hypothetical protein J5X98_23850 [Leptothermofonsia sichuanensis E412]
MPETNLLWFGLFLEAGFVLMIFWFFRPHSLAGDQLWERFLQLKKDYQNNQQEFQQQKTRLAQECARLRQALQQQNDQLMQDYLQHRQEWRQREEHLTQAYNRLVDSRDRLMHEFEQEKTQLTHELLRLQQELEHQKLQLIEEDTRLQEEPQSSQIELIDELRLSTFQCLQPLLVGYPTLSKIAHAKPDLSAKSLTGMFTCLTTLLQDWGYETIGPVWEAVAFDPQLHQADSPDIQPGETVYIRFVGYCNGEFILCPAKVSRTLPGAKEAATVQQVKETEYSE